MTKGYKKAVAPNGKEVMVTLLIPPHSRTNMFRTNVKDRLLAKHRCEFCLVLDIKDIDGKNTYDSAMSISAPSRYMPLIYRKGEYVRCFGYETKENVVCGGGIHYYLSYHRARFHKDPFVDGEFIMWFDDGGIRYHCDVIHDNIFDGTFREYDRDHRLLAEITVRRNIVTKYLHYFWEIRVFYQHKSSNPPVARKLVYSKLIEEYTGANIYNIIPVLKTYKR